MSNNAPSIPEHADFQVVFSNITKDGGVFNLATIQGWIFLLGKNIDSNPLISKSSTGTFTSGHFVVSTGANTVIVSVLRAEVATASGGGDGRYYCELVADTSGQHIRHQTKELRIGKNLPVI